MSAKCLLIIASLRMGLQLDLEPKSFLLCSRLLSKGDSQGEDPFEGLQDVVTNFQHWRVTSTRHSEGYLTLRSYQGHGKV